jgi:hypothetical protein
MRYRAAATPPGGIFFFFLCTALVMVVCLWLFALPAAAQEGPASGTPAQGTNPDSPSSPPDLVTIAAAGCTVSEGASITLEDPDGTQALFVDGQLGIEITSTSDRITIVGPNDDYIGDHAVSSSDPGFDTAGDYAVVTTTGIACQGGGTPPDETASPTPPAQETTTPAVDQFAPGPDAECPGAQVVETTTGTGPKQSPPFRITGERFRITIANDATSQDPTLSGVSVFVNKANGDSVTTFSQEGPGTDSSIINAGPGDFFIETNPANASYTIVVEDCVDTQGGGPPGGSSGSNEDRREEVVPGSFPNRNLPNTGGPAILAPAVAFLISGAAIGLLLKRRW